MAEQDKQRFFEHWITAYGNRLNEVARPKKITTTKLSEDLKEGTHPASPTMDLQPRPHAMNAGTTAKIPINRSHQ